MSGPSSPSPTPSSSPTPQPVPTPTPNNPNYTKQQAWDAAWDHAQWVDQQVQPLRDAAQKFRDFAKEIEPFITEANNYVANDLKVWKGDGKDAFVKQWNSNFGGPETVCGNAPQVLWALKKMSYDTADAIDKLAQAVGSYIYTVREIEDFDRDVTIAFIIISVAGLFFGPVGEGVVQIGLQLGLQAAKVMVMDILKAAAMAALKSLAMAGLKQLLLKALVSAGVAMVTDIAIQLVKQGIWFVDYTLPTGREVPPQYQFNWAEVGESGLTMALTEGLLHVTSPAVNTIIKGTSLGQSKWLSQVIGHAFAGLGAGGADAIVQGFRGKDWNWQEFWTNTGFGITMHLHDTPFRPPDDTLIVHGPGNRTYELNVHGDDMRFVDPETGKEIGNAIFDNSYQNEPRIHVVFDDPAKVWPDHSTAGFFDFSLNGTKVDVITHGLQQVGVTNPETGRVQVQKVMTESHATYDVGHDGTISRTGQTETFSNGRIRVVDGTGHVVENQFLLDEPLRVDPETGTVLTGPHVPGEILLPRESTVAFDAHGNVDHAMTPGWDGRHATLYAFGDDGRFQAVGTAHRGPDGKVVIDADASASGDTAGGLVDPEGRALFQLTGDGTNIRLAVPDTTTFEPAKVGTAGLPGGPADPGAPRQSVLPRLIAGAHSDGLRSGVDAIVAARSGADGHFVIDLPGTDHTVTVEVSLDPATGDVRLRLSAGDLDGVDQATVTRAVEAALHELADAVGRPLHVATGDVLGLRGGRADLVFHASGARPAAVYHLLESIAADLQEGGGHRVVLDLGDDLRVEFTTNVEGAGTRAETIRLTDVSVRRGATSLEPDAVAKILEPALKEVAEFTARPVELTLDSAGTLVVRPSDQPAADPHYASIGFSALDTGAPPELPKGRPAGTPPPDLLAPWATELAAGATRLPDLAITVRHGAGYETIHLTGEMENGGLRVTVTGDVADVLVALDRPELRGAVVAGTQDAIGAIADALGVPVRLDAGALAPHLPERLFEPAALRVSAEPAAGPLLNRHEVAAYVAEHRDDARFSFAFPVEHEGTTAHVRVVVEIDVADGTVNVRLLPGENAEALGGEIPREVVLAQVEEALHGIAEPLGKVDVYGALDVMGGPEAREPVVEAQADEPPAQQKPPVPEEMPKKAPAGQDEAVKSQQVAFDQIEQPIELAREQGPRPTAPAAQATPVDTELLSHARAVALRAGVAEDTLNLFLRRGFSTEQVTSVLKAIGELPGNIENVAALVGKVLRSSTGKPFVLAERLAELTEATKIAKYEAADGTVVHVSVEPATDHVTIGGEDVDLSLWKDVGQGGAEIDAIYQGKDGRIYVAEIKRRAPGLNSDKSVRQIARLGEWVTTDPRHAAVIRLAIDEKWTALTGDHKWSGTGERTPPFIKMIADAGVELRIGDVHFSPEQVARLDELFRTDQIDFRNPPSVAEVHARIEREPAERSPDQPEAVPTRPPDAESPPVPPGGVPPVMPGGESPSPVPEWQRNLVDGLTEPGAGEVLIKAEFHHDGRADTVTFSAFTDPETGEVLVAVSVRDAAGQISAAGRELAATVEEGLQWISTKLERPVVVSAHSLPGPAMGLDGRVYRPEPTGDPARTNPVPPEGGGRRPGGPEQPSAPERSEAAEPVKVPVEPEKPTPRSTKAPEKPDAIELDHWVVEHGEPAQYMGKVKRYPVGASAERSQPHAVLEEHRPPATPGKRTPAPAEHPRSGGNDHVPPDELPARIARQRRLLANAIDRLERLQTSPMQRIRDALDFGRRLNETYEQHLNAAKERITSFEAWARERPETGPLGWGDALRTRQDALDRLTREATGQVHDLSLLDRLAARARREVTLPAELTKAVDTLFQDLRTGLTADQQRLVEGMRETVVDALKVDDYMGRHELKRLVKGEGGEFRVDDTTPVPWAEAPVRKLRSQIAALDEELRLARKAGNEARVRALAAKLEKKAVKLGAAVRHAHDERVSMKIHELMTQSREAGTDEYRRARAAELPAVEQRVRGLRAEIGAIDDELTTVRGDDERVATLADRHRAKVTELETALADRQRLDRAERRYYQDHPEFLGVRAAVTRSHIADLEKALAEALRGGDRTMAASLADDLGRATGLLRWLETRRAIGDVRTHIDDVEARLAEARTAGDTAAVTRLETRSADLRQTLDTLVSTPPERRAVEHAIARVTRLDAELNEAEAGHAAAYETALDTGDATHAYELRHELRELRENLNDRREQAVRRLVTKLWRLHDEGVVRLETDLLRKAAAGDDAALGTLIEKARGADGPSAVLREAGVRGPLAEKVTTARISRRRSAWVAEDLLSQEEGARPEITSVRDVVADRATRRPLRDDDAAKVASVLVEDHFQPVETERMNLGWQRQQRQAYVTVLERVHREEERLAELTRTEPTGSPAVRALTGRVVELRTALDAWTESGDDALPVRTRAGMELPSSYAAENLRFHQGVFGRYVTDGSGDPRTWKGVTTSEVGVPIKTATHTTHREVIKDWLTGKQPWPDIVGGRLPVETKILDSRYHVVTPDGVKLEVTVYRHNSLIIDSGLVTESGLSMLRLDSGLGDGILPWWHMTPWGLAVEAGPLTVQFALPIGPNIDLQYLPGLRRNFHSYDQVGRETISVRKLSDPNGTGLPGSWTYETPATGLRLADPVLRTEQFYTKGGIQLAAFPLVQLAPTIPGVDPMARPPFVKAGIVALGQLTWEGSLFFDPVTGRPMKLDWGLGGEVLTGTFVSVPDAIGDLRFGPDVSGFGGWKPAPGTVPWNRVLTHNLKPYLEWAGGKLVEHTPLKGVFERRIAARALAEEAEHAALTGERQRIRGLLDGLTGPAQPDLALRHEFGRPETQDLAVNANAPRRGPNLTRRLSEDMLTLGPDGKPAYSLKSGEGHPPVAVRPTNPEHGVTPAKLDFTERTHQVAATVDPKKTSVLGDRDLATGAKITRPSTPGGFHLTPAELEMYARRLIERMYDTQHYPGEGGALIVKLATAERPAYAAILDNPGSTSVKIPEGWVVVMHYHPYGHAPGRMPSTGDVLVARGTPLEYLYVIHHASTDPAERAMILRVTRDAPPDGANWPNDPINDLKSPPVPKAYSDAILARQAELETRGRVGFADTVDDIADLLAAPPSSIDPAAARTLFTRLLSGAGEVVEHAPGAAGAKAVLAELGRTVERVTATRRPAAGDVAALRDVLGRVRGMTREVGDILATQVDRAHPGTAARAADARDYLAWLDKGPAPQRIVNAMREDQGMFLMKLQSTGLLHDRLLDRVNGTLEHAVRALENRPEHAELAQRLKTHLAEWDDVDFAIGAAYTDRIRPAHQHHTPLSTEDAARVSRLHEDLSRWYDVLTGESGSSSGAGGAHPGWTRPMHVRAGQSGMPGDNAMRTRPVAESEFFDLGEKYARQLTDPYLKARYETLLTRLRAIEADYARTGVEGTHDLAMAAWRETAAGLEHALRSPVARFHERYALALAAAPELRTRLSELHQEYETIHAAYADSSPARADAIAAWRVKADALAAALDSHRASAHETLPVAAGPGSGETPPLGEQAKAGFLRLETRRSAELRDPVLRARYDALLRELGEIEQRHDLSAYVGQRAGGLGTAMSAWHRSAALLEEMLESPIARHWDRYAAVLEANPKLQERLVALHEEYEQLLHALPGPDLRRDISTANDLDQLRWHTKVRAMTADLRARAARTEAGPRLAPALNALRSRVPRMLPRGPVTRRLSLAELALPDELDLTPRRKVPVVNGVDTGRNPTKLASRDLNRAGFDRDSLTGWTELTPEEWEELLLRLGEGMTNGRGLEYGGQLSPEGVLDVGARTLVLVEGGPHRIVGLSGHRFLIHSHTYGWPLADSPSARDFLSLLGGPFSHGYVLEHATANGFDRARILRFDRDGTFREVLPSELEAPRLPAELLPLVRRAHLLDQRLDALAVAGRTPASLPTLLRDLGTWQDRPTATPTADRAMRKSAAGAALTPVESEALHRYLNEVADLLHGQRRGLVRELDRPARLSKAATALDYVDRLVEHGYSSPLIRRVVQQDHLHAKSPSYEGVPEHHTVRDWVIQTITNTAADLPDTPRGEAAQRELWSLRRQRDEVAAVLDALRDRRTLTRAQTALAERIRAALRLAHDWWLTGRLDEGGAS